MQVERVIGVGVKICTPSTGFSRPLQPFYFAGQLAGLVLPQPGWATCSNIQVLAAAAVGGAEDAAEFFDLRPVLVHEPQNLG